MSFVSSSSVFEKDISHPVLIVPLYKRSKIIIFTKLLIVILVEVYSKYDRCAVDRLLCFIIFEYCKSFRTILVKSRTPNNTLLSWALSCERSSEFCIHVLWRKVKRQDRRCDQPGRLHNRSCGRKKITTRIHLTTPVPLGSWTRFRETREPQDRNRIRRIGNDTVCLIRKLLTSRSGQTKRTIFWLRRFEDVEENEDETSTTNRAKRKKKEQKKRGEKVKETEKPKKGSTPQITYFGPITTTVPSLRKYRRRPWDGPTTVRTLPRFRHRLLFPLTKIISPYCCRHYHRHRHRHCRRNRHPMDPHTDIPERESRGNRGNENTEYYPGKEDELER